MDYNDFMLKQFTAKMSTLNTMSKDENVPYSERMKFAMMKDFLDDFANSTEMDWHNYKVLNEEVVTKCNIT